MDSLSPQVQASGFQGQVIRIIITDTVEISPNQSKREEKVGEKHISGTFMPVFMALRHFSITLRTLKLYNSESRFLSIVVASPRYCEYLNLYSFSVKHNLDLLLRCEHRKVDIASAIL